MTRITIVAGAWAWALALGLGALSSTAQAQPIRFSTSGTFELPAGPVEMIGKTDATAEAGGLIIGAVPVGGNPGALGSTPFQLKFAFDGLPDIEVGGTILNLGYNPDLPVQDVIATTTAASAQIRQYPEMFQRLLAHPDWMHTTSFRGDRPIMELAIWVHPEDPNSARPVPEPSTALVALAAIAGLAWKARRRTTGDPR
ncbi:PEP-CTERM sorting domain-containing protein [Paludisphaera soli]|uniref:PEP-CTERM sorting domain-containing protein n=1 Tax=Paludisphaera soli TaxID=2712865 RepID=UPI0013EA9A79|nr:PEP-CTERM sorting domain-containing protein [Paludisphaera soli]